MSPVFEFLRKLSFVEYDDHSLSDYERVEKCCGNARDRAEDQQKYDIRR